MQCKSCLRDMHYCGSCDYDYLSNKGYCSNECFKRSKEYVDNIRLIKHLWESLDIEQQKDIEKLLCMDSYFHEMRFDDLIVPKREVLMIVGNVGSGKSFQAERLQKLRNAVVISRDSMRFGIGAGEYIFNNDYEPIIKKTALEMFQKFLTFGCNIIIDEVNIAKTSREPYIKTAHAAGYQIKAFVMPKLSKEESMARKAQKSYNQDIKVWETVWENFDRRYEEPTLGEGFDELIYHKEIKHGDN